MWNTHVCRPARQPHWCSLHITSHRITSFVYCLHFLASFLVFKQNIHQRERCPSSVWFSPRRPLVFFYGFYQTKWKYLECTILLLFTFHSNFSGFFLLRKCYNCVNLVEIQSPLIMGVEHLKFMVLPTGGKSNNRLIPCDLLRTSVRQDGSHIPSLVFLTLARS